MTPAIVFFALQIALTSYGVVDGDTLHDNGRNQDYRLAGIDTPETEPGRFKCEAELALGKAASARLTELLAGAEHVVALPPAGTRAGATGGHVTASGGVSGASRWMAAMWGKSCSPRGWRNPTPARARIQIGAAKSGSISRGFPRAWSEGQTARVRCGRFAVRTLPPETWSKFLALEARRL